MGAVAGEAGLGSGPSGRGRAPYKGMTKTCKEKKM
jgi:hypothetical protein